MNTESAFWFCVAAVSCTAIACAGYLLGPVFHLLQESSVKACEQACASTGVLRITPDECVCRPNPGSDYGPLSEPEDDRPLETP